MPAGVIPVVVPAAAFVVPFLVQRTALTRYDSRCGTCGATFRPWVTPVPKR